MQLSIEIYLFIADTLFESKWCPLIARFNYFTKKFSLNIIIRKFVPYTETTSLGCMTQNDLIWMYSRVFGIEIASLVPLVFEYFMNLTETSGER